MFTAKKSVVKCNACSGKVVEYRKYRKNMPYFVTYVVQQVDVQVDASLNIQGIKYALCGLVYSGHEHFTCRVIDHSGGVWFNDGIINERICTLEGPLNGMDQDFLAKAKEKNLLMVVYGRM